MRDIRGGTYREKKKRPLDHAVIGLNLRPRHGLRELSLRYLFLQGPCRPSFREEMRDIRVRIENTATGLKKTPQEHTAIGLNLKPRDVLREFLINACLLCFILAIHARQFSRHARPSIFSSCRVGHSLERRGVTSTACHARHGIDHRCDACHIVGS